ncbi:ATPase, T2SS/T4P/T4SS family [Pseudomonas syringae pv. actinidiae]|nr:ATPase, T2SS/T4P/T4SS family [Pseudomonas syringae pv. actinidiae]
MLTDEQKKLALPPASDINIQVNPEFPEFSDLLIRVARPESALYFPGPAMIPPVMQPMSNELMAVALQKGLVDFSILSNGIPFRGHFMPTATEDFYLFRRQPTKIWTLNDCGIRGPIQDFILSERLKKGGLIIVSGMPGAGKSTSCAAITVDRLKKFGGFCITIEDPVEMPLQGFHGDGVCLQRNVTAQEEFHSAVRDAMRGYPAQVNTMMLIGEVRDAETAAHALRASVDGRLVMITLHAGSIVQAVMRLLTLAAVSMGMAEARSLLSSSIRLVMNQKLVDKKLRVTTLFDTQPVAGTIMSKDVPLESLKNEIQNQMNRLRMKMEIKPRNLED